MLPKTHIIAGAIFSLVLYLLFPQISLLAALIIFLSSFLIDVDHYLYYVYKKKDFSLGRAYGWFVKKGEILRSLSYSEREDHKKSVLIFHGVEIIVTLILLLLSKFYWASFILIGVIFHYVLDFIWIKIMGEPFYTKISQIYVYQLNKKKKQFDLHESNNSRSRSR